MRNEEIVNAILKHRGYKQYEGNKNNLSSLMYVFMLDASYQVYAKHIRNVKCSGRAKQYVSRMKEGYHIFFTDLFSAFTPEQTDFLTDKMDAYEAYIWPHLQIAEIAIQECVNSKPIEEQVEYSSVWLCNLLQKDAQDFHGECWKRLSKFSSSPLPLEDKYINQVMKASYEYSKLRFGNGDTMTEKQFNRVQAAVKAIANKTAQWLVDDYNKDISYDGN